MLRKAMKWLRNVLSLSKTDTGKIGCPLCYDSGVVRLPTGNWHFQGADFYRKCPDGCTLTYYGQSKLLRQGELEG